MFISVRDIYQPHQLCKWKTGFSTGKKPNVAFPRYWTANNRCGIDDSGSTSTDGEQ
ncbi:MAG: hypothetical protein JW908_05725 [Anaerolineales bacterium]|nr:hypothetical protein [Anaerolineales bacterium]